MWLCPCNKLKCLIMGICCVFMCICVLYLILLTGLSVYFFYVGVLDVGHPIDPKPKYIKV
jgi:hypothetical protein